MNELVNDFSSNLDLIIQEINNLKSKGSPLTTLEKRIGLLSVGMGIIDKAKNKLLTFKEQNQVYDIQKVVEYDYNLSEYAERFYVSAYYLNDVLNKNAENPKIAKIGLDMRSKFGVLMKNTLQISARWHIERMINVFEFDTPPENRAFPKRKPLLQECIFFADRMNAKKMGIKFIDRIMPRVLIFAVQPNAGKSFVANVYSLMSSCLHAIYYKTSGILRMSNNTSNAIGFSDQIKSMLENEKIVSIYPEFSKYFSAKKADILEKSTSEEWRIRDLDPRIRASYFARGRDSAINSIRAFVALIIDDLSDGFDQMNNDEAHQEMNTKFEIDMDSRRENEDVPILIFGTMFNEYDVPNTIIRKLEEQGLLLKNNNFKNVRNTEDYSVVVVAVDCFDDDGNSAAPDLISTNKLKEKQNSLKPYEFDLVYRQVRASREPRPFEYKNLNLYTKIPETLRPDAIAVLDPTRKNGADNFSMPVFREDTADGKYAFVDCIYEQKSLGKLADPSNRFLRKVVSFIIDNNIKKFIIENNTSNTIGTLIDEKLKENNYHCVIDETYSSKIKGPKSSKMERILNQEATIVANIKFPAPSMYPPLHHISLFMTDFTHFDTKNVNKKQHDDAPDSVAIFSDKCLYNKQNRYSTIKGFSKSFLWS